MLTKEVRSFKRSDLPTGFPVSFQGTVALGNETQIIAFPELTGGLAVSMIVKNRDAVAALGYQLNVGEPLRNVAANGADVINDMFLDWIRIVGNVVTGDWECNCNIISMDTLKRWGFL